MIFAVVIVTTGVGIGLFGLVLLVADTYKLRRERLDLIATYAKLLK